ncbi:MAG: extracellular solute-binding protein [Clostridia bacterium]|nr:extracellular solute-binding protein [Clostridia bacterium]
MRSKNANNIFLTGLAVRLGALMIAVLTLFGAAGCKNFTSQTGEPSDVPGTHTDVPAPHTEEPAGQMTGSIVIGIPEMYDQRDRDALEGFAQEFRKVYPGVSYEMRIVSNAGAALKAEAGSPDYADVVFFPGEETFGYAYVDNALLPLDKFVTASGASAYIHSGVVESCTVDGVLYALGTNCDPLMLIYNKDAYEAICPVQKVNNDWTFAEFCELCRELGESSEDYVGAQLDFGSEPLFLSLLRVASGAGKKAWADVKKYKVDLQSNTDRRELDALLSCYTAYFSVLPSEDVFDGISDPKGIVVDEIRNAFSSRTPVFRAALLSELGNIAADFDLKGIGWDVAPFPLSGTKGLDSGTAAATDCFGVRADTSEAEAASAFVMFSWTEEGQSKLNSLRGTLPAMLTLPCEPFIAGLRGINAAGKNFAACVPAKDRSVPAYFSCAVPPEVAGFLSSELRSAAGRIITVRTSLPDVLYRMDTMGTQNYWMRNYYPDFVN